MEKQYKELQTILSEELKIHNQLVDTAGEMNSAIKTKNVDTVQMLTAVYDTYIGQVEMFETRRLELCDTMTKTLKPHCRHLSLRTLISLLPKKLQKPFTELRASLKGKIDELVRINTSNQLLLNESLSVIQKNFDMVSQFQNKFAGYKQSGNIDTKTIKKNILNQIA